MRKTLASLFDGFEWRYLRFSFLIATIGLLRRFTTAFSFAICSGVSPYLCILGMVIGCVIVIAVGWIAVWKGALPSGVASVVSSVFGLLALLACLVTLAVDSSLGIARIAPYGFYACVGGCLAVVFFRWIASFSEVKASLVVLYVAYSCAFGACLKWLASLIQDPFAAGCAIFLSLGFALLVPDGSQRHGPDESVEDDEPARAKESPDSDEVRHRAWASCMSAHAVGLGLCFFGWGATAVPPELFARTGIHFNLFLGGVLGAAVFTFVGIGIIGFVKYEDIRKRSTFLCSVLALFLALIAFVRMTENVGPLQGVLAIGEGFERYGFVTLFVVLFAVQVKELGVRPVAIMAPTLAACCALFSCGMAAYALLDGYASYLQIAFVLVYIVVLALQPALRDIVKDKKTVKRCCAVLAKDRALTARESEILTLLALGYSVTGIAKYLTISVETVRVHKRHVYAKLDVHRHEELIDLVHKEWML